MTAPPADNVTYLGVGLYSIAEAARIIGVAPSTLRTWVKTYTNKVHDTTYVRHPVIVRYFGNDEPVLTFVELVELLFVKLFRQAGVKMSVIRKAAERAMERFQTPYPFASQRFDTDGTRIFVTLSDSPSDDVVIEDVLLGQRAFEQIVRPFFHHFDYHDNLIVRTFWPRQHSGRVVLDPQRAFGKPIDAETGVPTVALYEAVITNPEDDAASIAQWFAVPVDAVHAAVEYERSLQAA